jgi:hypothetical protein
LFSSPSDIPLWLETRQLATDLAKVYSVGTRVGTTALSVFYAGANDDLPNDLG